MRYRLTDLELLRLKNGLQASMATFFVDSIEDYIWEAVFSYTKQITFVDPLDQIRKKLLYDVVDNEKKIGWSAKTIQLGGQIQINGGFEVVIQRADIFDKSHLLGFGNLTKETKPEILGKALLKHWRAKVIEDARLQGVEDKRVCILLKGKNYTFGYLEESLYEHTDDEFVWNWTNSAKKGLQGKLKSSGQLMYRWYPSGYQLFEHFIIPSDIQVFELAIKRLPADSLIDYLVNTLNNSEYD